MQENIMNAFTEQAKSFYSPLNKLSTLMVENMEKMTEFQLESIKSYADITMSQMKKAVDVKDVETLRSFSTSQAEAVSTVNKKIMEDAKSLSDLATDFKEKVEAIWEEAKPTSKSAEKKATKAA